MQKSSSVLANSLEALPELTRMVNNVEQGRPADSFNYTAYTTDIRFQAVGIFIFSVIIMYCVHPQFLVDPETKDMKGNLVLGIATSFTAIGVLISYYVKRRCS